MNKKLEAQIALDMLGLKDEPNTKLAEIKLDAVINLGRSVAAYLNQSFLEELVLNIYAKKAQFIKQATTKKEIEEILSPPKVRHDGNKVVPVGKYHVPEEELLVWSLTSLHAPLNSAGFKRYTELFRELLPTEAERALGDG